jgi:hypothetical protein
VLCLRMNLSPPFFVLLVLGALGCKLCFEFSGRLPFGTSSQSFSINPLKKGREILRRLGLSFVHRGTPSSTLARNESVPSFDTLLCSHVHCPSKRQQVQPDRRQGRGAHESEPAFPDPRFARAHSQTAQTSGNDADEHEHGGHAEAEAEEQE